MPRFADPDRCPDCAALIPPGTRVACASCGLPLQGQAAADLFSTLQRADRLLADLRAQVPVATGTSEACERVTAGAGHSTPAPPVSGDWPERYPAPAPRPHGTAGSSPVGTTWTVPAVLLSLGGLCLVVAALVFLAVTWSVLGVGGRTAVLVGFTALASAGATFSHRRRLRGAAETLATVAGLFFALDVAGAFNAGWLGSPAADTATFIGALVVSVATAAANRLLATVVTEPEPPRTLVAPQLISAAAAGVAAAVGLVVFSGHVTTTLTATVLVLVAAAAVAAHAAQPLLAACTRVASAMAWCVLLAAGAVVVAEAATEPGAEPTGTSWQAVGPSDVASLLAAAALAALFAAGPLAPRLFAAAFGDLPAAVTEAAGRVAAVAAWWLLAGSVAAVIAESLDGLAVVAFAATVAIAAAARGLSSASGRLHGPRRLWVSVLARTTAVATLGPVAAALVVAVNVVAGLVAGVEDEVAAQLDAQGGPDLRAVADLGAGGMTLAAPWTLPLAVVGALVGASVIWPTRSRPGPAVAWSGALVAFPVLAATALAYAPALLSVVVAAGFASGAHLVSDVRRCAGRSAATWSSHVDVVAASAWACVAGAVALYHPAPAFAVTLVAAGVVTGLAVVQMTTPGGALRGRPLAPLLALSTALAASAVATLCWLTGCPVRWAAVAGIVVTSLFALSLGRIHAHAADRAGERLAMYVAAGLAGLVNLTVGISEADAAASAAGQQVWLAVYLTLMAAGAAAVAIAERSRVTAWIATGLQLWAAWVRLADAGVETPEAYTLPLAAALLGFGCWALAKDATVGTLRTLLPGLTAALAPTLVIAATDPVSVRAALLAGACSLLVAVGARWRLLAPLLAGAACGAALVVVELVPYHDAVPRWALLTAAGLSLLVAGVRWEHLASAGRRSWARLSELR